MVHKSLCLTPFRKATGRNTAGTDSDIMLFEILFFFFYPNTTRIAEITGCCNGIKLANHKYHKDIVALLTNAVFPPNSSDDHNFYEQCQLTLADSHTLNVHVDDCWYIITCSTTFRDELKLILQSRYGCLQRRLNRNLRSSSRTSP